MASLIHETPDANVLLTLPMEAGAALEIVGLLERAEKEAVLAHEWALATRMRVYSTTILKIYNASGGGPL